MCRQKSDFVCCAWCIHSGLFKGIVLIILLFANEKSYCAICQMSHWYKYANELRAVCLIIWILSLLFRCQTHLPGYVEKADELKSEGVNEVVCVSVNDPFVLSAWGKEHKACKWCDVITHGLTIGFFNHEFFSYFSWKNSHVSRSSRRIYQCRWFGYRFTATGWSALETLFNGHR